MKTSVHCEQGFLLVLTCVYIHSIDVVMCIVASEKRCFVHWHGILLHLQNSFPR